VPSPANSNAPPRTPKNNERAGQCTQAVLTPGEPRPIAEVLPDSALASLHQQAEKFVRAAPSTLRAYRSDWEHFTRWCQQHTLCTMLASPETVALYLTALAATHRPVTITRRLTAITKAHQIAGEASPPAVSETLKGIRRTQGGSRMASSISLEKCNRWFSSVVRGFATHDV
jgi:hypothetical protein